MIRKKGFVSGSLFVLVFTSLGCFFASYSYAQIVMRETGSLFQDFNTLQKSGVANGWTDYQTIPGWYWRCGDTLVAKTYYSDDGTSPYVGKRSYGATGDADRAIGGFCNNNSRLFSYGMKLFNSSSQVITNLSVGYTGEQWRVNQLNSPRQISFYFKVTTDSAISLSSTPNTTNGWTLVNELAFVSPKFGAVQVVNGNNPSNRRVINEWVIPGMVVPPKAFLFLRWNDAAEDYDHGLAIDDVSVKWTVPGNTATSNVWNGSQSTEWSDPRNWSKAVVPGADSDVDIAAVGRGAVSREDLKVRNLTIRAGGLLAIEPGKTLTVTESSAFEGQNCMILKSPLTLLSNNAADHAAAASFLSQGIVSGSGSIKVERFISEYLFATDGWHFYSSPVNNPAIESQFLPGNYDALFAYSEMDDAWLNQKTTPDITNFINGLGYMLTYNDNAVRSVSGMPNNKDIVFANMSYTGSRGWHLLGNPFPCGISWGGLEWGLSNLGSVAKLLNSGGTYTDVLPGDTIPAMNGFFVKANALSNSITIPRAARLHSIAAGWKRAALSSDKRLKFVISSDADNTFAETRIVLTPTATTGYDLNFDSPYLSGMQGTPLFYSVTANGKELSTNCVPDSASLKVDFEFRPGLTRAYTFRADISAEWLKGATFVLEDKKTKATYALRNGSSFKFTADTTDLRNRFRLVVDVITHIGDKETVEGLKITSGERHVDIDCPVNSGWVFVYEVSGRQVCSGDLIKGKISFDLPCAGVYVVKLVLKNGIVTRKIIVGS